MARAERNEEKNVKNYNYEWQTDEEIVANAHTKIYVFDETVHDNDGSGKYRF